MGAFGVHLEHLHWQKAVRLLEAFVICVELEQCSNLYEKAAQALAAIDLSFPYVPQKIVHLPSTSWVHHGIVT